MERGGILVFETIKAQPRFTSRLFLAPKLLHLSKKAYICRLFSTEVEAMETKRHIYEAPECITVVISTERGILTESILQVNMTLSALDFSASSLVDGGSLGDL